MNRILFFLALLAAAFVQHVHAQAVGVVDDVTYFAQSEPGGSLELQSRSVFEYNGPYVTQSTDEVWTGQSWAPESRTTYSGNLFNMETGSSVWNAVSASWEPVDQTTIEWFFDLFTGEIMAPASEVYAIWDGTAFVNDTRTVYTYDDNAVIEVEQTDTWNGGAWIPTERELYTEENGQVMVTTQEYDGAAWTNTARVTWPFATRAEFQELALELAQSSVHYDGILLILASLPVTTTDYWTGSDWMPAERGNALYDLFTGRRLSVTQEMFDGQTWTAVSRLSFAYNESGQMTNLTFELADGPESWSAWQSDSYTWNDKNDLASISSEIFPGTEFAILTRTDLTWRYFSVDTEPDPQPVSHELLSTWPNPFNPSAQIGYRVATSGDVTVAVYDQLGRHIATLHDGFQSAGEHQVTFRADHLPSGNYVVRMTTPVGQSTRMMTLLK
ncbi:MAG: T9SS type A sorting domain-containing protein [Rhodothermales bacterium]